MNPHDVGRGLSPTPDRIVGHQARPPTAFVRRHLASGFWLLILGLRFSILDLPAAAAPAAATPPAAPLDLGRGLAYVRLHRLPDDFALLSAAWSAPALIVDLRYPKDDGTRVTGLGLPPRPRAAPLLVLVGPGTPAETVAALRLPAPDLITLGLQGPGGAPDIALAVKPEADRRAYDALDAGASVESLIGENMAKPRFDEAVLAHEHTAEVAAGESTPTSVQNPTQAPPANAPAPAPPPAPEPASKDVVLQRAVQLHRALLALGKLPPG